jgi:hypothetical protein
MKRKSAQRRNERVSSDSSGRNKHTDNQSDYNVSFFQSTFRPEIKERLKSIEKNWVSGPRSVLCTSPTPSSRLSVTLKLPPMSMTFKKDHVERQVLQKSFISTNDKYYSDANTLTLPSIQHSDKGDRSCLRIPEDNSIVDPTGRLPKEISTTNHDKFKLSVFSKSGSQNNMDSELELNTPTGLNSSDSRDKGPVLLVAFRQETERLTTKIRELEQQLEHKSHHQDTPKSKSAKSRFSLEAVDSNSSNFKQQVTAISTMMESRNFKMQDTRMHIALLKKHLQDAQFTIAKLQKNNAALECELNEYKSNNQDFKEKAERLKVRNSKLKEKARQSVSIVTDMSSRIISELTNILELMSNQCNDSSFHDTSTQPTGEASSKLHPNILSKFKPYSPRAHNHDPGSQGDSHSLHFSHKNRENGGANPLGLIWQNSVIESVEEIQRSLCMSCAVETTGQFKTIVGLTNRLQLTAKGDQLALTDDSWQVSVRYRIDSLFQSVKHFNELFKEKFSVVKSAKLIF